jgi:hypothetical protein
VHCADLEWRLLAFFSSHFLSSQKVTKKELTKRTLFVIYKVETVPEPVEGRLRSDSFLSQWNGLVDASRARSGIIPKFELTLLVRISHFRHLQDMTR